MNKNVGVHPLMHLSTIIKTTMFVLGSEQCSVSKGVKKSLFRVNFFEVETS